MPIYEFDCFDCKKSFDVLFKSIHEKRRPVCTHCGSSNVGKRFSLFGIGGSSRTNGSRGGSATSCSTCSATSCATCK